MPFGWHNAFPFRFGGGPTLAERLFKELTEAHGYGLLPEDLENSIEGLMLIADAKGLAAAASFDEAAAMQAFPSLATDLLKGYEEILQFTSEEVDEADRRDQVAALWVYVPPTVAADIETALRLIDTRYAIMDVPWLEGATTHIGRGFEGWNGEDAFGGGRTATTVPAYSTNDVFFVTLYTGIGVPLEADRVAIARGKRLLHDSLPAWMSYQIATHPEFILDLSVLDGSMLGGPTGGFPDVEFVFEEDGVTVVTEEDAATGVTDE